LQKHANLWVALKNILYFYDNQSTTSTARNFTYLTGCKSTVQSITILKPTG